MRAFHLTNLEDLPDLPDFGVEGQMRINENGEIVDAEAEPEEGEEILLPGEDVPEP